ncbi:hypothetical protein SAY87_029646 [Trapa incisa]|uniref:XS domain-containing protein n=1 Tax=Trapa incisa TaxID=236973 RepID=A0AAN7Q983_9MYRT|nr:hypothetical protein SAY87_029646 [Trapa incisa]
MVICLGNPADQSVMIVKFLGTFSGFRNALKLGQFFADDKLGRIDLQKLISSGCHGRGTNGSPSSSGLSGEEEAEKILYGYMGIAEDLDKVDFRTKKVNTPGPSLFDSLTHHLVTGRFGGTLASFLFEEKA